LLIGDWIIEKSESVDGTGPTEQINIGSGEPSGKKSRRVTFKRDGSGYYHNLSTDFQYQIEDSLLSMGNREYKIIAIDRNKMVLEDLPTLYSLGVKRHYYKRYSE